MKKFDYPDIEAHKRGHKRLLRTLLSYKREFDEGERDIYSLKGFMYNWVRDHIQDEDRRIGDHIRAGREKQAELAAPPIKSSPPASGRG